MKKIMKWTGIVLGGLTVLIVLTGVVLYPIGMGKLTQTYPNIAVETIRIPTTADAVARGQHIAMIWACTRCHGEDLSGTLMMTDPIEGLIPILGTIPAANLTSGKGGIGKSYTDADWVRAIRHGIKPDNRVEIFMSDYSTLSDQDLGDLIAYLKQIPPVDTDSFAADYGPIVPIAPAVGLFTPVAELIDHSAPRPADPAPGATQEYGQYLSAICAWCHGKSIANQLKN
jgi:cytochrome c553